MEQNNKKPVFFNKENNLMLFLCIICFGLFIFSTAQFLNLVSAREEHFMHHNAFNPTNIQDWMTFSYINHVFNLPPNYLKNALTIQSKKYPNVSLKEYAEENKINKNTFLLQVKGKVNTFQIMPR